MPRSFVVEVRPGRGRCLIAATRYDPGELVMKTSPASVVLQDRETQSRCGWCLKALGNGTGEGKPRRCSSCKQAYYCSKSCQERDWVEHRPECKVLSGNESGPTPTRTIRLAARILQLMNRSGDKGERLRGLVDELVHHNEQRSQPQRDFFASAASVIARLSVEGCGKRALSWPSASGHGFAGLVRAAYDLLGKIACNVFTITSELGQEEIACGLYPEASVVNHSCMPNAVQSFHGRVLSMRCIRPILPGEEVTIGITELHLPGRVRRRCLADNFFFQCRCERCDPEREAIEDGILDGYACPTPKCMGLCVSGEGAQQEDVDGSLKPGQEDLFCNECGACRSVAEAERVSRVIHEKLERGKACVDGDPGSEEARMILQGALKQATSPPTRLHRASWILSGIYGQLVRICLQLKDFDAAARYALDALDADRQFWFRVLPNSVVWANQLAVAGKLLLCIRQQPVEALGLFEEALPIFRVTHGDDNSMYRELLDLHRQAVGEARAAGLPQSTGTGRA